MWKSILSYSSVLSLAAQSSRWEHAMQEKLIEMAAAAAKAASLQISAQEQQALALQAEEQANMERAEAAELQQEAVVLFETSETNIALALEEKIQAEELMGQVAAEEEQSALHAAAAALDETTADVEFAEATADTAQATRAEIQAHGEEVGIGICEFIPGLDVLCNVIGGITAVGMETFAAGEAVKATEEFATATLTKADEEREAALAVDWQGKAAEDTAAATELSTEQAEQEELAEEEKMAGEEKETQAETLIEHAELEEDTAIEEEGVAAGEMDEAATLLQFAITQGVLACWDSIMATVFGVVACLYFGIKTITKTTLPSVVMLLCTPRVEVITTVPSPAARNVSYNIHHGLIFTLIIGIFSNLLEVFHDLTLRARGGLILEFGVVGALVQTLLLHILPEYLARSHTWKSLLFEVSRAFLSLFILYMLEILIIWAGLGQHLFTNSLLSNLNHWVLWVMALVPIGCHVVFLEIPHITRRADREANKAEQNDGIERRDEPKESDCLLPTKTARSGSNTEQTKSWWSMLREDLSKMQLPFEVLMATCMIGLLIHCIGAITILWPTSKALLLTTKPDWLKYVGPIVLIVLVIAGVISTVAWWRRRGQVNQSRN